ncbi:MAG: hypothetical protein K2G51_02875 [Lachnospiraceae bacterium]|nr:hypothetical protein [Lachnospiraceae bacterium]
MNLGNAAGIVFSIIGAASMVLLIALPIGLVGLNLYDSIKEKSYMGEQRQTGRDKQRMLDFMQIVMKEYYHDYMYAVGNNKILAGRCLWYFYPYIVCFNETDIVVISYVMRGDGTLICRNVLPIDWSCMRLKYRIQSSGVKLVFQLGKTKMRINVNRIVGAMGAKPSYDETGDTPLGVYQEQEVDQLIRCLPNYMPLPPIRPSFGESSVR